MKAVQFDRFGGSEVLDYREVAAPEPGPNEVLIDIACIGVNHLDIDVREGMSGLPVALPHTLGTEAAGVVAAIGASVDGFAVGDPVATYAFRSCGTCDACTAGRPNLCARIGTLGAHDPGTYAEQIALPVDRVVKLPEGLSPVGAVASYKLVTAWEALVDTATLQPGETVAITGAGGSVGSAAVVLAKHLGAKVIAIASSDARCARIAQAGADHTINYRAVDLAEALLALTDGKGVDLVFDVAGGEGLVAAIKGLAWGGRVTLVGAHAGEVVPVDMVDLFRRHLTIFGCGRYTRPILESVLTARAQGLGTQPIHTTLPLAEAAAAHRLMESRAFFGRILLTTQQTRGHRRRDIALRRADNAPRNLGGRYVEHRTLGPSGLSVSLVGLGCNNFGGRIGVDETRQVVDRALDLGINFFDTADVYGNRGGSEECLGQVMGDRRKDIILATKFAMPMSDDPTMKGASREYIMKACEASLKRLKTDWIDLYQVHQPDSETPIEETLGALDDLIKQGKVRHIGSSNYSAAQLDEAQDAATGNGWAGFVSCQDHYSLLAREIDDDLLPAITRRGLGLLPYFPLASGFLTGKYTRDNPPPEGTRMANMPQLADRYMTERNWDIVEGLDAFAKKQNRSLLELAFAWLAARPNVSSIIAGATHPDQVSQNAAAVGWTLNADEMAEIDAITGGA